MGGRDVQRNVSTMSSSVDHGHISRRFSIILGNFGRVAGIFVLCLPADDRAA